MPSLLSMKGVLFMFKIHRYKCAGLDVHKNIIVATIGITDPATNITSYFQQSFSTYNSDLIKLRDWITSYDCFEVCMESTGKYWIPVYNILEADSRINVVLVHPKYVKAIKGQKTDKKDANRICDFFKHDLVTGSFIPPADIRALRDLCRYRFKLVCIRSSERNRYQNCMTVSNIGLASALTDPFGKTASSIMNEVLTSDVIDDDKIKSLIHKNCKKKDEILLAVHDCNIQPDQKFKMNLVSSHLDELDKHIESIEVEIFKRASKYFDSFLQITTMEGIKLLSAILIISEIGVDMDQFETDQQLANWAGLAPENNQSANKKKSTRISKAGQYLKPLLVQCALAAIKIKDGYFRNKYLAIKRRRGHKKAIIAIARMMLVSIYHMIQTGAAFNPSDYESIKNPKPKKNKEMTVEKALEFLAQNGYDTSAINLNNLVNQ